MIVHHFAGNPLNRSVLPKDEDSFVAIVKNPDTKVLIVVTEKNAKRIVCTNTAIPTGNHVTLAYFTVADVLRLRDVGNEEDLITSTLLVVLGQREREVEACTAAGEPSSEAQGEVGVEDGEIIMKREWIVAVDLPESMEKMLSLLPPPPPQSHTATEPTEPSSTVAEDVKESQSPKEWSYSAETGRTLLFARLQPLGELAIAGQALAMVSWHNSNLYDGKLGLPTYPIECGMKRRCSPTSHKVYPRIDPAAISLVISPDRQKFLLGRMSSMPANFYSCLSGYIEPCESVAEAVRREVHEESGVVVDCVELIDSQPWPIGRGGSCELMLGCVAYATTWDIVITEAEVADVKWFSLDDARRLVAESLSQEGLPMDARSQQNKVFIPGPYALAHHLIKKFVELHESGRLLAENESTSSDSISSNCSEADAISSPIDDAVSNAVPDATSSIVECVPSDPVPVEDASTAFRKSEPVDATPPSCVFVDGVTSPFMPVYVANTPPPSSECSDNTTTVSPPPSDITASVQEEVQQVAAVIEPIVESLVASEASSVDVGTAEDSVSLDDHASTASSSAAPPSHLPSASKHSKAHHSQVAVANTAPSPTVASSSPSSREVAYWKAVAAVSAIVSLLSFSLHIAAKLK